MTENIISNPFVGCTARDMQYEEVQQYWCSPFELYRLNEGELYTSHTPIVIEGVRGTGKTMILKYLSYKVQKDALSGLTFQEKLKYFRDRSFGIYFRYKADFCNLFDILECSQQYKERIFKQYYELFIIREILEALEDLYQGEKPESIEAAVGSFLGIPGYSMLQAHQYINIWIKKMDGIINVSGYDEEWQEQMMPLLGNGNMVPGLVAAINNSSPEWKEVLFNILLDEYENLDKFQTVVNTLIKQVDDTNNITYRLGMRPAGMENNNSTNVGSEKLQVDRDFVLRRLEYEKFSSYKQFALEISKRRLESVEIYRNNDLCNILDLLGRKEDFDQEARQVVKNRIRHFKLISASFPKETMENVIAELTCEKKLMEMYNILRVARGEEYTLTADTCRRYQELQRLHQTDNIEDPVLRSYHLGYSSKYRVTMLYMLLTIYGERKKYYSVNTFLRLSSGSINDFISLCRNVFKQMNQTMLEELKNGGTISIEVQDHASLDTAEDQKRKVGMSNHYGTEMYTFIDNLGGIFEAYHRDLEARYPETNQFAFADENEIKSDEKLRSYLVELINSGAIIRKSKRQLISVGKPRGYIYQLNKIFAPIYQYSYRTRGGYNQIITKEDFREMLKKTVDPQVYVHNSSNQDQYDLFDSVEDDEDETSDI